MEQFQEQVGFCSSVSPELVCCETSVIGFQSQGGGFSADTAFLPDNYAYGNALRRFSHEPLTPGNCWYIWWPSAYSLKGTPPGKVSARYVPNSRRRNGCIAAR